VDVFATKDQGNAEPQRFWNRKDAKGAKGFIYFLIGVNRSGKEPCPDGQITPSVGARKL